MGLRQAPLRFRPRAFLPPAILLLARPTPTTGYYNGHTISAISVAAALHFDDAMTGS